MLHGSPPIALDCGAVRRGGLQCNARQRMQPAAIASSARRTTGLMRVIASSVAIAASATSASPGETKVWRKQDEPFQVRQITHPFWRCRPDARPTGVYVL